MANSAVVGLLRVVLSANTAEFETAMKTASDSAKTWSRDLNQIGKQAQQIGAALTKTITVPIVAAFAGASKAAMDFESSFANVAKTVDGVSDKAGNLTTEGKALALTFRNMAKEIPKTTDELTAIAALGGQMGVPIKNLEKFTKNVAALGVAVDGISAEQAAAGLAQIANVFGDKEVKNIDKMSSALVHLGNSSNATEADILDFTKRLAGAGNSVGMTIPQIMALGTAMANVGLNAEAGGTAMSTVIAKIGRAVSEGGAQLTEFARVANMSADGFAAVWKRSPIEALDAFVKGLSSMKDRGVDLNLTMGELGTEGIRVADTLKRLAGAGDGIAKSLVIANEGFAAGNKHLEEAEKKYATTANQLKLLWNQIKDVGITLGNALLPAIKSATSTLSSLIPVIDALANGFAMLPGPIQMSVVGMGLALAATGPLIYGFGTLARASADLAGAFTKKGIATRALSTAFGALGGSASTALSWITRLGAAARASGLLFAGFSAAIVGIAVPVALAIISEHIRKINEQLDRMIAASKLVGRTVTTDDEARRLLAAQQAGAEGQTLKPKPFEPLTVDELNVWSKAKGAAEAYEGQVVKVTIAQKDANAQFADTRNLTIDQVQAVAKMGGAVQQYAGGVLQIGQAAKAAKGPTTELAAAQKALAEANAQYAKDLKAHGPAMKLDIQNMEALGLSVEKIAAKYHVSVTTVERYKKELEAANKTTKQAETAAEQHAKAIYKQREALQKLGIVTSDVVLDDLADLERLLADAGLRGVGPMDRALAAMLPKLRELKTQADASGIEVHELEQALQAAERAAQRAAGGIAGGLPVLRDLQLTLADGFGALEPRDDLMGLGMRGRAIPLGGDVAKGLGLELPSPDEMLRSVQGLGVRAGQTFGGGLSKGLQEILQRIPDLMTSALTGGGGFSGFAKAVASTIGSTFGKGMFEKGGLLGGFTQKLLDGKGFLAGIFGKTFSGALGLALPGIGGAIGSLVGPLMDKIGGGIAKLFGGGDDGDKERNAFLKSMGGFDALAQKLHALGAEGDRLFKGLLNANSGKAAAAAIDAITTALGKAEEKTRAFNDKLGASLQRVRELGGGVPEALRPMLEALRNAGQLTEDNIALLDALSSNGSADWKTVDAALQRYGANIEEVGGAFQDARLHEAWQQIIDDVDLFASSGIDANAILDITDDKIIELVQQSQKFGTEIPENMRPWIEKLIEAGSLVDENGEKITDIGDLTFGETLQTSIQNLTDTIKLLIDEFNKVPGAARNIPSNIDTTVTVRRRVIDEREGGGDDETSFAWRGGLVTARGVMPKYMALGGPINWTPRGMDRIPIMGAVGEGIVNRAGMGILGADGLALLNSGKAPLDATIADALHGAMQSTGSYPGGFSAPTGSSSPVLLQPVILQVNRRELGRAVVPVVPPEARRLGVRVRV